MIPRILAPGAAMPADALVLDCGAPGGRATYSHWRDAPPCPAELVADSSTGMALRAAADPARWLSGFAVVVNDHADADGLLSLAVACNPGVAVEHAALIVGAAEAGDFQAWPGEAAFRLMLRVHQVMRDAQAAGDGWEQRAADAVVAGLPRLIDVSRRPDAERDAATAQVLAVRERLVKRDGFTCDRLGDLVTIAWESRVGHAWDQFGVVHQPDDLPLWALGGLFPDTAFQLCAERVDGGTIYVLDAPRHSWARTIVRPAVAWPDLERARRRLDGLDQGRCRWAIRPEAQRVGFVCQLASVDGEGRPAPSAQTLPTIASAIREALRLRPAR